jgi:transcriptional regulator with XRE-family HTH domain
MTRELDTNQMKSRSATSLAIPVKRALHTLGSDIRDARRRRRLPMALLAKRALLSRTTLTKIERGDPGVSVGAYATVLFVLGMVDRFANLADPRHDSLGRALDEERLPQRVRIPRAGKPKAAE